MTVLLIGAGGWLGSAVMALLPDARAVSASQILNHGLDAVGTSGASEVSAIVNLAGVRQGDPEIMQRLNSALPARLAAISGSLGVRIVHLGSAAEYGLIAAGGSRDAARHGTPDSEYGRTKLAGSAAVLATGRSCVLRAFNIAAGPPQQGTPLADVLARVRRALTEEHSVELLSAMTARDWVSKSFVLRSVLAGISEQVIGAFDICSGRPTTMGELAEALALEMGQRPAIRDRQLVPATSMVGDPRPWRELTGLAECLSPAELARVIIPRVAPS